MLSWYHRVKGLISVVGRRARASNNSRRRHARSTNNIESLEAREYFAADVALSVPSAASLAELTATLGIELPQPETVAATPAPVCAASVTNRDKLLTNLPAPLISDLNYDGRFSSEDLVLYYQDKQTVKWLRGVESDNLDETLDLISSLQLLGYETGNTVGTAMLCSSGLVANLPSSSTTVSRAYYPGTSVVRSITSHVQSKTDPRYRAVRHFDRQGKLQSDSFELYRDNLNQLYSRSFTEYDTSGNIRASSTQVFDEAGQLRRLTSTAYPVPSQASRTTDVWFFDASGKTVSRKTIYYDSRGIEVGLRQFGFDGGKPISVATGTYDSNGQLVAQSILPAPADANEQFGIGYSQSAYLAQIDDAYAQALTATESAVVQVLRMNQLPSQSNLSGIISQLNLPEAEASRYRRLQHYFNVLKNLSKSRLTGDYTLFYKDFANSLDPVTGDWAAWFSNFVEAEHLTMPIPPLTASVVRDTQDATKIASLANAYRQKLGLNPQSYLEALFEDQVAYEQGLLESLRKVKSNIKMLELRAQSGGAPVFDWVIGVDSEQLATIGTQPLVALTSHYFFPYVNGKYILDEVNEDVVRERVEKSLTNEDAIYLVNIEVWDINGVDPVPMDYIAQLRRATDLLHKYNPNLLVGYYRMLPQRAPNATYLGEDSPAYKQWQERNDIVADAMLDSVDVIFPSLYVLHLGEDNETTEERWKTFATESIRESRRIAEGRPVVPFLMLYYHRNGFDPTTGLPNNLKGNEWIEPELLYNQMLQLDELADGMVLYNDRYLTWNTLVTTELAGAVELFHQTRLKGTNDAMRARYDTLMAANHSALLAKLEAEKTVRLKQFEQSRARSVGNTAQADAIAAEIQRLEIEISRMVDLWTLLTT